MVNMLSLPEEYFAMLHRPVVEQLVDVYPNTEAVEDGSD